MEIDANEVIQKLVRRIGELEFQVALLQTQIDHQAEGEAPVELKEVIADGSS